MGAICLLAVAFESHAQSISPSAVVGKPVEFALKDSSGNWKAYERSRSLSIQDLEVASAVVDRIFTDSKFKRRFEQSQLRDIAQSLVVYSSVDTVGSSPKTVLFYNGLADVFLLGRFGVGNDLVELGIISGRAISKTLEVPESNHPAAYLVQRPLVLKRLKQALQRASAERKDLFGLFKQYSFDQNERDYLAVSIFSMIVGMAEKDEHKCASEAKKGFEKLVLDGKPLADVSPDLLKGYQLLSRGEEEEKGITVFTFGEVLLNRSRVLVITQIKQRSCSVETGLTMTIIE
jgi:hypothetical protein